MVVYQKTMASGKRLIIHNDPMFIYITQQHQAKILSLQELLHVLQPHDVFIVVLFDHIRKQEIDQGRLESSVLQICLKSPLPQTRLHQTPVETGK